VCQIGPGAAEDIRHFGFKNRRVGVDQPMGAVFLDEMIPIVQRGAAEAGRRRVDLFQSRHDALPIFFFLPLVGRGRGGGREASC